MSHICLQILVDRSVGSVADLKETNLHEISKILAAMYI